MSSLLEVSGVSVTFDGFRAINNLSFQIGSAELRAIIGRNALRAEAGRIGLAGWSPVPASGIASGASRRTISPSPSRRSRRVRTVRPDADALAALLTRHRGTVRAAAEELGVGRNTLYRWLGEAGLSVDAFRD